MVSSRSVGHFYAYYIWCMYIYSIQIIIVHTMYIYTNNKYTIIQHAYLIWITPPPHVMEQQPFVGFWRQNMGHCTVRRKFELNIGVFFRLTPLNIGKRSVPSQTQIVENDIGVSASWLGFQPIFNRHFASHIRGYDLRSNQLEPCGDRGQTSEKGGPRGYHLGWGGGGKTNVMCLVLL